VPKKFTAYRNSYRVYYRVPAHGPAAHQTGRTAALFHRRGHQIVIDERPAPPVLEPLFADMIPADVKIPDFGRDTLEVLAPGSALQIMLAHIHAAQRKPLAWARFWQAVP